MVRSYKAQLPPNECCRASPSGSSQRDFGRMESDLYELFSISLALPTHIPINEQHTQGSGHTLPYDSSFVYATRLYGDKQPLVPIVAAQTSLPDSAAVVSLTSLLPLDISSALLSRSRMLRPMEDYERLVAMPTK